LPSTMAFRKPTKAKSAMKKAAVTKAAVRKAMKTKRVTKVAHGRLAKALVLRGRKEKTSGGLTTDMLMINKRGKIVSKRASANGKRRYKQIEDWTEAVMGARDILHVRGFLAINGKSLQGRALYMKAQMLREKARRALCTGPAPSPTALAEHPSLSSSGPACVATSPALEGCISGCMPMGSGVPQGSPATLLH